jgi:hypothetical protein
LHSELKTSKVMRKQHLPFLILFLVGLNFIACRKDEPIFISKPTELYDGTVATDWFEMFRTLTKKTAGFTPPVAARAFGYAGVTLYETVMPGMPQYQSLASQLEKGLVLPQIDPSVEYNFAAAANAAMAEVARLYYPTMPSAQLSGVILLEDNTYNRLRESGGMSAATLERSKVWGKAVANAVFEWSKTDGGHQGYSKNFPTTYPIPTGLGFWEKTFPAFQLPMQPYWGNNRTFIPRCTELTQPSAPMPFSTDSTSLFHKEALVVYNTVVKGSDAQKATAKFWSDDPGDPGTPPGHSVSITTIVLRKESSNLAIAAEVYARVGIGLSDAFVSCWKCKYVHNLMRPITYLRRHVDPSFTPILTTPPFPEYSSGHSVQAGTTARILTQFFGNNYTFTDNTHQNRTDINGNPRTYKSFYEFANEAAISRLYGGIHYREGIEKGVEQGVRVGAEVMKMKFKKN